MAINASSKWTEYFLRHELTIFTLMELPHKRPRFTQKSITDLLAAAIYTAVGPVSVMQWPQ